MDKSSPKYAPHDTGATFSDTEVALLRITPPESAAHRHGYPGFLRFLGAMVVAVGVVLTALGSISLFSSWGVVGGSRYYWAAFLGLPLIAIGSAFTEAENLSACDVNLSEEMTLAARERRTGDGAVIACERCRATNAAAANFCNQCGTALNAPACVGCGARITWNARFCTYCGKSRV